MPSQTRSCQIHALGERQIPTYPRPEWYEIKPLGEDFGMDGVLPLTTELASVEECSKPDRTASLHFATMRLVRMERCFQGVCKGTSPHGGQAPWWRGLRKDYSEREGLLQQEHRRTIYRIVDFVMPL